MEHNDAKKYIATLKDVKERFTSKTNTATVSISFPKMLHEQWKKRKAAGMRRPLSDVIATALHFALLGPHPFSDPLEALEDAFRVYVERSLTEKEIVVAILKNIAKTYGVDIEIKGL